MSWPLSIRRPADGRRRACTSTPSAVSNAGSVSGKRESSLPPGGKGAGSAWPSQAGARLLNKCACLRWPLWTTGSPSRRDSIRTRPAVADPVRELTYGELDAAASTGARRLAAAGVRAGDRVAVALPAGIDFAVVLHALPRLGAVLVPLNPAERERQLDLARPRLVVDESPAGDEEDVDAAGGARPGRRPHAPVHLRHDRRAAARRADLRQPPGERQGFGGAPGRRPGGPLALPAAALPHGWPGGAAALRDLRDRGTRCTTASTPPASASRSSRAG